MKWGSEKKYFPTTKDAERIPSGRSYVYHAMPRDDMAGVMTEGLRPFYRDRKWDVLHAYLDRVAEVEDINLRPESRAKCIFCHSQKKYGVNSAGNGTAVAVIDTDELKNSVYRADRESATAVARMLNKCGSTVLPNLCNRSSIVDDKVNNPDAYKAYVNALRYWKSCFLYDGKEVDGITEVLIDSCVPEDAIVTFYMPR